MKTRNVAEKVGVVPSESKGIGATIAELMRRRSVIDIVERFQTLPALQEERETRNFHPSMNGSTWPDRSAAFADPVNRMNSKASIQRKSKS